ncbi:MAG: M48 family metalloprotease [Bacteroidetes bacterium]|nr:M48 family metalloprotease [Bacteroidota bacterium]
MQLPAITGTAQHFIQSFSWMLIHSLWQGLLLSVVTAVVLMLTKRTKATVRYNLVFGQFALFLLACGITFIYEWNRSPRSPVPVLGEAKVNSSESLVNIDFTSVGHFARICMDYFNANAPMIVLLWFVVFLFRAVRMMGSLVYIHRAKHHLVYQPSEEWKARADLLCQKLQLKKAVQLLESGYVKMPMVIGHLKPMILVPVGLLAGLPAGQVEAVLLHELAHIRRNDYVVNFMQTIAETVFFFNPGLLWISSQLRDERENCCDDIALEQTKNKREFIEALISFKEHSLYGAKYEVAFPGKKNHLLNRVSRILNNRNKTLAPAEKGFFMAGVLVLSVMVTTAAIAEVHTTITKHKKTASAAIAAIPAKAVVPAASAYPAEVKSAGRAANLPEAKPAPIATQAKSPQQSNLENVLDKMRNKFTMDRSAYSSLVSGQQQKTKNLSDQQQARLDQIQAAKDQEEARKDQAQALIDQEEARKDQAQARIDQEQAKNDQEQARLQQDQQNKENAEQVKKNEDQAKRNAEQAIRNQEQVVRNQQQAQRNALQVIRNQEQDKRNVEQAARNEEQARKNAEQEIRNAEQAKKNQVSIQQ